MEKDNNLILPASILFSAILISGALFYNKGEVKLEEEKISSTQEVSVSSRDVILGDVNAPVTMIVYGDYQCSYCGKFFNEAEKQIREEYVKTGKVKLVHRNFTFMDIDRTTRKPAYYLESRLSAEAAECAKDQGKFWDFHDAIYVEEVRDASANNGNLQKDFFMRTAQSLALDVNSFEKCVVDRKYKDLIENDYKEASTVGVNSTPTVYVNQTKFNGALPFSEFKNAIDRALQES